MKFMPWHGFSAHQLTETPFDFVVKHSVFRSRYLSDACYLPAVPFSSLLALGSGCDVWSGTICQQMLPVHLLTKSNLR